ncbi:DUF1178 family protein [Hylemonella gracilis]|jgi:hypothetical protein|uniref:DUF1178 family protein n=1 Tax=Hylemonella gracilis TaxID=80880 RepID=A0A4P6ULB6_9BURK|nr:DUF1178 family protein [Hylemonella gracilis]QBK05992.1 DUF1178 family protein [Hylemonella gracilis]
MKVFNLRCGAHHSFEGWFASEEDYANQTERGLLECPLCGDKAVHKLPSAPRINLGAKPSAAIAGPSEPARADVQDGNATAVEAAGADSLRALQAAYLQFARHVAQQTEDVGERFAEEARKIHYGESEERGIRGKTSPKEAEALMEEGISVMPLFLPEGIEGPLQ